MASKRAKRRKACGHKRRYQSETEATAALWHLHRGSGSREQMITYRCQFCGGFHFGHPPANVLKAMAAQARRKGPLIIS